MGRHRCSSGRSAGGGKKFPRRVNKAKVFAGGGTIGIKLTVRLGKKRRKLNIIAVAGLFVLVVVTGIFAAFQFHTVQRKFIYRYPYQNIIKEYALRYGVDSNLAAAVIKAESKFDRAAVSHRGAVGLMQIMPDTGDWIARQLEDQEYATHLLGEPETNIRYGLWYLASLKKEFANNDVLALAAYNAGRGNVQSWMEEYGWDYDFADIDAIPFAETREYVRRVLQNKEKYRELYQK